jgi:hypothetical protein
VINKNEELKEYPKKGNLFFNFGNIFLKKQIRRYIQEK